MLVVNWPANMFVKANNLYSLTSGVMGLPTMLQVKDISVSLPQKRNDLDGDSDQAVDRLIAIIKLTMGMDEIINEGYEATFSFHHAKKKHSNRREYPGPLKSVRVHMSGPCSKWNPSERRLRLVSPRPWHRRSEPMPTYR